MYRMTFRFKYSREIESTILQSLEGMEGSYHTYINLDGSMDVRVSTLELSAQQVEEALMTLPRLHGYVGRVN